MYARFTVLSDTPIAAAIAGCVIPLSRNSTIWMRCRCAAGIFQRSAVLSRRTSALLHLPICFPRIRWHQRITPRRGKQPTITGQKSRFKPLWKGYKMMRADAGLHPDQAGLHVRKPRFHLAARPLLSQHNRTALIVAYDVERVLSDIDPDHSNCTVEFLWHGVLLVLAAPASFLAAGLEHGRTIPLA